MCVNCRYLVLLVQGPKELSSTWWRVCIKVSNPHCPMWGALTNLRRLWRPSSLRLDRLTIHCEAQSVLLRHPSPNTAVRHLSPLSVTDLRSSSTDHRCPSPASARPARITAVRHRPPLVRHRSPLSVTDLRPSSLLPGRLINSVRQRFHSADHRRKQGEQTAQGPCRLNLISLFLIQRWFLTKCWRTFKLFCMRVFDVLFPCGLNN